MSKTRRNIRFDSEAFYTVVEAAELNEIEELQKLIDVDEDVNVIGKDSEGLWDVTPLGIACLKGNMESVELLLGVKGIDINMVDGSGCSALFHACSKNRIDIVLRLLNFSTIDFQSASYGTSPLMISSYCGNYEICKSILSHPNFATEMILKKDIHGDTCLTKAKNSQIKKLLLYHLADDTSDEKGVDDKDSDLNRSFA
jgi:ankyrin repeat protein